MNPIHETFDCAQAAPLIPAWADGELSEARSAPLREHLLGCRECRASMADLRALTRWFQPGAEVGAVPPGFAARVARRAFAGDTGERATALDRSALERRRTLDFVLLLTAVAAALVIALGLALRALELPAGERLHADDRSATLTTEEILQRLDALKAPSPETAERQP